LQDSENPVRRRAFRARITVPRPSRQAPPSRRESAASIHRKASGMNARYRKNRWRFWRINGNAVSIR
jgi:hypothetical protein